MEADESNSACVLPENRLAARAAAKDIETYN
jgi:hypothetical protein